MVPRTRSLPRALLLILPALLLSLTAFTTTPHASPVHAQGMYTLNVMMASDGSMYFVDANGKPQYTYTKDVQNSGVSTVTGGLLNAWPALTVQAGQQPTVDPMAMGTLGTITRDDGTIQVTYNGWPIYGFVRDTAGAAPTGNNVAGFALATP